MSSEHDAVYDVSKVNELSDLDLAERQRRIAQIERAQFHDNLNATTFTAHSAHHRDPALDDARWAVEKEMKRRGMWPPTADE
ncbi:MAG: hypothetical protein PIR02_15845 [Microbacterium enclense]